MSDVTAQEFREAATWAWGDNDPAGEQESQRLLLAAAEQREQLDALRADNDLLTRVNGRVTDLLTDMKASRDRLLIAGNHLATALSSLGVDPAKLRHCGYDAVLETHGPLIVDIWVGWKTIMEYRDNNRAEARP